MFFESVILVVSIINFVCVYVEVSTGNYTGSLPTWRMLSAVTTDTDSLSSPIISERQRQCGGLT